MLYYVVVQELSEVKNTPVAKFASNNRTDMDLMWMNIKCRVASDKKRVRKTMIIENELCFHCDLIFAPLKFLMTLCSFSHS